MVQNTAVMLVEPVITAVRKAADTAVTASINTVGRRQDVAPVKPGKVPLPKVRN